MDHFFLRPLASKQGVERRQHEQGEQGSADKAADDDGRDWLLNLRARAVANAIGTKPSEATRAVMAAGLSRVSAPS